MTPTVEDRLYRLSEALALLETLPASACACERCRQMCRRAPCLPTPDETGALLRAGYEKRLYGAFDLTSSRPVAMVTQAMVAEPGGPTGKRCTFLGPGDRCELHALGLKPRAGQLAHHAQPNAEAVLVHLTTLASWETARGFRLVELFSGERFLFVVKITRFKLYGAVRERVALRKRLRRAPAER